MAILPWTPSLLASLSALQSHRDRLAPELGAEPPCSPSSPPQFPLPPELLLQVGRSLAVADVLRASQVNWEWYRVMTDPLEWQLRLAADGLQSVAAELLQDASGSDSPPHHHHHLQQQQPPQQPLTRDSLSVHLFHLLTPPLAAVLTALGLPSILPLPLPAQAVAPKQLYALALLKLRRRPKHLLSYARRNAQGELVAQGYFTPKHLLAMGVGLGLPLVVGSFFSRHFLLLVGPRLSSKIIYLSSLLGSAIIFKHWSLYYDSVGDRPLEFRYRLWASLGPLFVGLWASGLLRSARKARHEMLRRVLCRYRWRIPSQQALFRQSLIAFVEMVSGFVLYAGWVVSFDYL